MLEKIWFAFLRWLSVTLAELDPALARTRQECWVEAAAKRVAADFNLQYVPARSTLGVRADVVFCVGGLPICGVSRGSNNNIPPKVLARVVEPSMRQLTKSVGWEYSVQ